MGTIGTRLQLMKLYFSNKKYPISFADNTAIKLNRHNKSSSIIETERNFFMTTLKQFNTECKYVNTH